MKESPSRLRLLAMIWPVLCSKSHHQGLNRTLVNSATVNPGLLHSGACYPEPWPLAKTFIFILGLTWLANAAAGNTDIGNCTPEHLIPALEDLHDSDQQARAGLAPSNDIWNQQRFKEIITECGWPDIEVVGRKAALGAFLVLQHAPLEMQLAYAPLLRAAAQKGHLAPGTLPLLEDRILVRKGLPQRYGTQFSGACELHDIADPENVDQRRAAAGLPRLADYVEFCHERASSRVKPELEY